MYSHTENEGKQYDSSGNALVDFLANAAAQRPYILDDSDTLISMFDKAFNKDNITATKLMFWLRDPRNGAGEKAAFNKIIKHLYDNSPDFIMDNLDAIIEYGSYKSLIDLASHQLDTDDYQKVIDYFASKIYSKDRLANKWAPRLKSNKDFFAKRLRDAIGMSNSEYRKWIKEHSETTEQLMSENKWADIDYSKVPSVASRLYKKAFDIHDNKRYDEWKNDDTKTVNASVTYPHEVLKVLGDKALRRMLPEDYTNENEALASKLWKNLPNFIKEGERIIPMIDTSGSMEMYSVGKKNSKNIGDTVLDIAVALGLYISEKGTGNFKNSLLTFSSRPELLKFDDSMSLIEKLNFIFTAAWSMNTNFEAAYRLILNVAKDYNLTDDEMPTMLLVLSDMQFDNSERGGTPIQDIKKSFEEAGYKFPKLVFWNLRSQGNSSPARYNNSNVAMISGFSPSIMKSILALEDFNPVDMVYETVEYIDTLDFDRLATEI